MKQRGQDSGPVQVDVDGDVKHQRHKEFIV